MVLGLQQRPCLLPCFFSHHVRCVAGALAISITTAVPPAAAASTAATARGPSSAVAIASAVGTASSSWATPS